MLKPQNESMKNFTEYHLMPTISASSTFLNSTFSNFCNLYDFELHTYIDQYLIRERFKDQQMTTEDIQNAYLHDLPEVHTEFIRSNFSTDIIEQEISFIEDVAKYLIHKKRSNLRLRNINIERYISDNNDLDPKLIELYNQENRSKEDDEILTSRYIDHLKSQGDISSYCENYIDELKFFKNKIRFLKFKAEKLNYKLSISNGVETSKIKETETNNIPELESEEEITKREKFLILNELEIIDLLMEKLPSKNNDAPIVKVLRDITGHNMQYLLNSFKNRDVEPENQNNPYKKCKRGEDPVNKVRSTLMKYGYKDIPPLR